MNESRLEYKHFDFNVFLKEMGKDLGFDISQKQIRHYMRQKGILEVEFNYKNNTVLALEPVKHGERQFWIDQWLKKELSNKKLLEKLHEQLQWVEYIDIQTFLESVESCLNQN